MLCTVLLTSGATANTFSVADVSSEEDYCCMVYIFVYVSLFALASVIDCDELYCNAGCSLTCE